MDRRNIISLLFKNNQVWFQKIFESLNKLDEEENIYKTYLVLTFSLSHSVIASSNGRSARGIAPCIYEIRTP